MKATLDQLYRAHVKAELGNETFFVRALSSLDTKARIQYAYLGMARVRALINDPASYLHELYIDKLADADDADLKGVVIAAATSQAVRESAEAIKPVYYPIPDNATNAEVTEIEAKRQADVSRLIDEQEKYVAHYLKPVREKLDTLQREELLTIAKARQVEQQCDLAFNDAYYDYTIYASFFTDSEFSKRKFSRPEQVSELDPRVRNAFVSLYRNRVDTIGDLDLQYFFSMDGSSESVKPMTPSRPNRPSSASVSRKKSHGGGRTSSNTGS